MITIDPQNFTINSDASILDLPALHQELRDWEDSEQGAIHPVTHTWKALDLVAVASSIRLTCSVRGC